MTSKEQDQPNRRYIAILSLPNRRYEVILSLRVVAKQSQVDHDIEDLQAKQTLEKTPVSSTWKSGNLELTANAFYNDQKTLTKIIVEVADFTSDEIKPIKKCFSFLFPLKNEEIIELKSSQDFTVCGYLMLKMPSAYPDDVLLFLSVDYGEKNNRQHIEGGVLLIKLSSPNLSSTLSIFEDMRN
ncbi:hypothetical protein ACE1AT_08950 [Pelatocladus sp. BLCC-F211]|uniref:hypothetical protein n=1 Tax=Pelatocladus sp. BLCC-F211 TaxID=3342752 RepID=UPI0035B836F6